MCVWTVGIILTRGMKRCVVKRGQIQHVNWVNCVLDRRNTPEYIAHAVAVCKFLKIEVVVSAYEADWQVMYRAIPDSLVVITGDSDLLAIGPSPRRQMDTSHQRL
jgi:hypothetical protein